MSHTDDDNAQTVYVCARCRRPVGGRCSPCSHCDDVCPECLDHVGNSAPECRTCELSNIEADVERELDHELDINSVMAWIAQADAQRIRRLFNHDNLDPAVTIKALLFVRVWTRGNDRLSSFYEDDDLIATIGLTLGLQLEAWFQAGCPPYVNRGNRLARLMDATTRADDPYEFCGSLARASRDGRLRWQDGVPHG